MSASATLIPAAGGKSFTGFTKLCKGLAVILFLAHILVQLFPSAAGYLALIPARTIPFAWNLVTAGYIEQTIPGLHSSFWVLWSSFRTTVDSIYCCIYLGCCKLLPEGINGISSNHIIWYLYELDLPAILPKETRSRPQRDPSDEFSFSSFFPGFLRPILDPIASIFHKLLCGRSARPEGTGQALDGSQFPGSGSIEANRRRERGQRALEQRLAEIGREAGTPPPPNKQQQQQQQQLEDDASDKV